VDSKVSDHGAWWTPLVPLEDGKMVLHMSVSNACVK
jgi:hypothetical protein